VEERGGGVGGEEDEEDEALDVVVVVVGVLSSMVDARGVECKEKRTMCS